MVSNGVCMFSNAPEVYSSLIHMLHATRVVFSVSFGFFEIVAELICSMPIVAASFDIRSGKLEIPMAIDILV